jgi:predicted MFS family arabinose efflux permease
LFPLILSVTFVGILGNTVLAPAIPDILDEFGVDDRGAGILIAATSAPGVVMAPIIGVLADRFGRRRVLVPCLVLFGGFGAVAALAPTFEVLVAARFGMGLGAAGLINMAIVLISDNWADEDRTRLIGRNAAFLTVCLAVLPPIGGMLTQLVSWRLALAMYTLAFVPAFAAWRILDPATGTTELTFRAQLRGIGIVVRQRSLLVVYAAGTIVFVLVFGVFLATLPIHLEDQFGFEAGLRGLFLAIPAVPSTIVAFHLDRLRAAMSLRVLLVTSALMFAVGFTLLGAPAVIGLVVVGCVVYGLAEGALIPTLQDLAVSMSPPMHRAAVVAVFVAAARLGQTIGPLGAAALFDATSTSLALQAGALIAVGLAMMFYVANIRPGPADDDSPSAAA